MEFFINYINSVEISTILRNLRSLMEKREITTQHIQFLHQAIQHDVTPKAFRIELPKHFETQRKSVELRLIRRRLREHYRDRNNQDAKLKYIHRVLTQQLHYIQHEEYIKLFRRQVYYNTVQQNKIRENKLKHLINEKNKSNNVRAKVSDCLHTCHVGSDGGSVVCDSLIISPVKNFPDRFTNLANVNLHNNDKELLELGHKYCPNLTNTNTDVLAVDLEVQLTRNIDLYNNIKNELNNKLRDYNSTSHDDKHSNKNKHNNFTNKIERFQKFIKDNNLIITNGDKNAGMVILEEKDYIQKTEDFFHKNKIVELKNNPLPKYVKSLNKKLENHKNTLNKIKIPKFKMKVMNPHIPQLKSLIKLHKPDKSIRPIVTNINTPASKIAKALQSYITNDLKFKSKFSINNSTELIDKIKDIHISNKTKLISFDITNLYSNIPIQKTLRMMKKILDKNIDIKNNFDIIDSENILDILEEITNQNFFLFNNKHYQMQTGLSMGSPISGLMAEIFLDEMEKELFSEKHKLFTQNIKAYFRYVDDIIIIHEGSEANIVAIQTILNNLTNLNFTIEKEIDNNINFLDLNIKKNNNANKLEFGIFRKPTTTDVIIPKSSNSPNMHKEAAFRFLINRANSTPLNKTQYLTELNYIMNVGRRNGYSISYMQNIYNKIRKNNITKHLYPHMKNQKQFVCIPYNWIIDRTIKPILQKHDIRVAYKANTNLKNLLSNNKHKIPYTQKSGVYIINCNNCKSFYVGQTGRSLKDRFQDHINRNDSNMCRHLKFNKHSTTLSNIKLIHNAPKSKKLNLLEEMEIERHRRKSPEHMLNEILYAAGAHLFDDYI